MADFAKGGGASDIMELSIDEIKELIKQIQTSDCPDEAWVQLAKEDDWKIVMQLMVSTLAEEFEVSCLAACAMAFLGNIYKNMWSDYSSLGNMQTFGSVTLFATSTVAIGVLMEYDFRDFQHGLIGMEDFSNMEAFSKTWVLLMQQLLQGIRIDNNSYSLVDIYSQLATESDHSNFTLDMLLDRLDIEITAESGNSHFNQYLKQQVSKLILTSATLSPDVFSDMVSALVWANWLLRSDICPFAEIPWMICLQQFKSEGKRVDYSEVILHHLNEVGYPYHSSAEAMPVIQLCIDLIKMPNFDGYFYYNDTKIIIDHVIREFQNIPDDDSHAHKIRNSYIDLLEAIVTQSAWKSSGDSYKLRDMMSELNQLYERNGIIRAGELLQALESI